MTVALRRSPVSIFLELTKFRIATLVSLSTATGVVLFEGRISTSILPATLGIYLMASGSAALNEYQERELDRLMNRTKDRPIPAGLIAPRNALFISGILLVLGALVLGIFTNLQALFLGTLNALWYNGIYTPLKKITPYAVFPGAMIGAIPPLAGWAAAGGNILAPPALMLAAFFFVWQIPHFWLLLLNFGKDYERAGFPSLTQTFSPPQLGRLTFIWLVTTALVGLALPLYGMGHSRWLLLLLLLAGAWLVAKSRPLLYPRSSSLIYRKAFRYINTYVMMVMLSLVMDRLGMLP